MTKVKLNAFNCATSSPERYCIQSLKALPFIIINCHHNVRKVRNAMRNSDGSFDRPAESLARTYITKLRRGRTNRKIAIHWTWRLASEASFGLRLGRSIRLSASKSGWNQTLQTHCEPQNSLKLRRALRTLSFDFDHSHVRRFKLQAPIFFLLPMSDHDAL